MIAGWIDEEAAILEELDDGAKVFLGIEAGG
jgi:hypothetical protein